MAFGSKNESILNAIKANGQSESFWDVDTLDWQHRNPKRVLEIVKAETRANSVLLMHHIHESTLQALPEVIEFLKAEGYIFVTVSQLNSLPEEVRHQ